MSDGERRCAVWSNPVLKDVGDPWAWRHGGRYYVTGTESMMSIQVRSSASVGALKHAEAKIIYRIPGFLWLCWGPQVHFVRGGWYAYFASQPGPDQSMKSFRMWVVRGTNPENPMAPYYGVQLLQDDERPMWMIDLTVIEWRGRLFAMWSGMEAEELAGEMRQSLWIAEMDSPVRIRPGTARELFRPKHSWEMAERPIMEGPRAVVVDRESDGKTFVGYSASAFWSPDYCIGMLEHDGVGDFLDVSAWRRWPEPALSRSSRVLGPGAGSYTDNDVMFYHGRAAATAPDGWFRDVYARRIAVWDDGLFLGKKTNLWPMEWDADGALYEFSPPGAWCQVSPHQVLLTDLVASWGEALPAATARLENSRVLRPVRIAFTVRTLSQGPHARWGVCVYDDGCTYIAFLFDPHRGWVSSIVRGRGGRLYGQMISTPMDVREAMRVEVEIVGGLFRLSVDGRLVQGRYWRDGAAGDVMFLGEDCLAEFSEIEIH